MKFNWTLNITLLLLAHALTSIGCSKSNILGPASKIPTPNPTQSPSPGTSTNPSPRPQAAVADLVLDVAPTLTKVTLNWTASLGNFLSYKIMRNGIQLGQHLCIPGNPCSYIDTTIDTGSFDYSYQVNITDPSNRVPDVRSNTVEVTFTAKPADTTNNDPNAILIDGGVLTITNPPTPPLAYSAAFLNGFYSAGSASTNSQIPGICMDPFSDKAPGVSGSTRCDLTNALGYCILVQNAAGVITKLVGVFTVPTMMGLTTADFCVTLGTKSNYKGTFQFNPP